MSKYAHCIVHVCPTALLLYFTYRFHITAYISKISKQIGFELSSHMHMYYAFGNYIYCFSSVTMYVFLVWQTYFVSITYVNYLGNCTHVYNAQHVLSWEPQLFYICRPHLFFHIYDPWSIPCLALKFVLVLTPNLLTFQISQSCLFFHINEYSWIPCLAVIFLFFTYANNFWNCTYMYTYTEY